MAGFSPEWLGLREPADHAARNPQVLGAVGAHFAGRSSLTVVDLGCGAGSNLRGSYAALPARQHWTLVDLDERLLAATRQTLSGWADEAREQGEELVLTKGDHLITVDTRQADLNTDLEWVLGWQPDLVTAAALFDLTSRRWLERFVAGLTSLRLPLYTVLTYDGREIWQPPHPADAPILAAFKHHQRGDKGFGPAAGPEATDVMAEAFRKSGFAVSIGDSAWRIDARSGALAQVLAKGIAEAVLETGQVDPATVADWLAAKMPEATALVGHHDLWARPV
ncbi:MAG TPA: class I SAM-dependent methyltransferase [Bosea sp. (in: a-proteobacteria)]|jgi:SAM-dependent methyltransferase|uniref:class I SAM-dependent methyltransferase n=1 Tax=Bosea sp. (in: a-proteobacteria) TaxID=1871050 RepID=UPI002DDCFB56|nr:class I SAM-dependent methyltransferase [Bosea sp. (in: a-proteobacteria)]HEV2552791.1 class I SAM-dependent methyltransferase [Bosea sp. (in: a-proteobacteria)]